MRFDTSNYKKKYDYGIYICSDRAFFLFFFQNFSHGDTSRQSK